MTNIQSIKSTNQAILCDARNRNSVYLINILDYRFTVLERLNKLIGLVLASKTKSNINKIEKLIGKIYYDFVVCNFIEGGDLDYSVEVAFKTFNIKPTDKEDLLCSLLSVCQSINTSIGVNEEKPQIFSRYDYTERAIDTLMRVCKVYGLNFGEVILGDWVVG